MISSILLLVILQILWLKSSYENAYISIRRETSTLLRSSVFALRDSLFMENLQPVKTSSGAREPDSIFFGTFNRDTVVEPGKNHARSTNIQVYIAGEKIDSVAPYLAPLAAGIPKLKERSNFVIRIGNDSISVRAISREYLSVLSVAGLDYPFKVRQFTLPPPDIKNNRRFALPDEPEEIMNRRLKLFGDTLYTDPVRLNPLHAYSAVFPGMRANVISEISPQIFFSIFLTFITSASFMIMYRNLRTQQRLMEMKNDFISNVTHELKTPVATVSVALEALKDFNALANPEKTREYLTIAQNELNRLTLMTDKILKAAAFESQGVSFIPETVDLSHITEHVVSSLKIVFERNRLDVRYSTSGRDFSVEGSELHLTNVLYNLIDNAIKYSPQQAMIEISLIEQNASIEISVKDQGVGIPREYQNKIFEKFFRVPTGDVHNVKGYGLGLNYVAEVVRIHNGHITVNSDPGSGSCFMVSIPKIHGNR